MKGENGVMRTIATIAMSMQRGLLLGLSMAVLHACTESPVDAVPSGAFSFTQYDSLGTQRAAGWIKLVIADSSHISGEWHIAKVGMPASTDAESNNGVLVGETVNGQTILNLHPSFVDNNLILIGTLTGTRYTGIWQWITFAGVSDHGTFQAQRR